jgi:hypothetical protein
VKDPTDFVRRLDLVRRIAQLHSNRKTFTHDEELQFLVAARLFTFAELQAMHAEAVRTGQLNPEGPGTSE